VYCVEQADHANGVAVEDLRLDPAAPPHANGANADLGVPVTLVGPAVVEGDTSAELYRPVDGGPASSTSTTTETTLTAIPYYRWANRGPNAMRVWIPTTSRSR
jgi:DUF1680 family protein